MLVPYVYALIPTTNIMKMYELIKVISVYSSLLVRHSHYIHG